MLAAARLQDDTLDALLLEQMRQEEPAGPAPTMPTCVRIAPISFLSLVPLPLLARRTGRRPSEIAALPFEFPYAWLL
jgi:hypothetical protein